MGNTVNLYKYIGIKYALDIIENQWLYLSDGTDFNDPFDVTVTNSNTYKIEHVSGLRILSLTNSYQNKLMWSHYTEAHKGMCLTVEVPKRLVYPMCYISKRAYNDSNIDELIASRVKYEKKNLVKDFSPLSGKKKIGYIKDKKWIYEKEYRIVFDENDDKTSFVRKEQKYYMPVKIKNIYLGVNFGKNDEKGNKIIEACKQKNIQLKQMELSGERYAIRIKGAL